MLKREIKMCRGDQTGKKISLTCFVFTRTLPNTTAQLHPRPQKLSRFFSDRSSARAAPRSPALAVPQTEGGPCPARGSQGCPPPPSQTLCCVVLPPPPVPLPARALCTPRNICMPNTRPGNKGRKRKSGVWGFFFVRCYFTRLWPQPNPGVGAAAQAVTHLLPEPAGPNQVSIEAKILPACR